MASRTAPAPTPRPPGRCAAPPRAERTGDRPGSGLAAPAPAAVAARARSACLLRLSWPVACQRHPMHHAAVAVVVVQRVVLRATVVPEGDRARPPAEAAGELGL